MRKTVIVKSDFFRYNIKQKKFQTKKERSNMSASILRTLAVLIVTQLCHTAAAWTPAEGVEIYPVPASKSQWLWAGDKPVANNAVALFRTEVKLGKPVKKAVLNAYFDDAGFLWVNGRKADGKVNDRGAWIFDITELLRKGGNTLAFQVRNHTAAAGLLYFGTVNFSDGKTCYLHSTPEVKSVTGPLSSKWFLPDFDDSKWLKSKSFGDIAAAPWAGSRSLGDDFTTPAERKRFKAAEKKAFGLPDSLKNEALQPASIVMKDGITQIAVGGKTCLPIIDLLNRCGIPYTDSWIVRHRDLGLKIFHVTLSDEYFLKPDGRLDFSVFDKSVRRILTLAPDARIILQVRFNRMRDFCLKNPDETIAFGTGPVNRDASASHREELSGRPLRPSAASLLLREEIDYCLRGLADYINKNPWGKRVIGLRLSYGIFCEWHSYGMYEYPDMSKPSTRAFRTYLKKKYGTVDALRKAWQDPAVDFANAQVPSAAERDDKGRFFRNPQTDARALDFFDCYARVHADLLLFMAKRTKELLPGRLCGAYYGYALGYHPPEGSNVLLEKVLSSPYIDFLSSPPPYTPQARLAGGDFLSRSIANSFIRHGKLLTIEDDSRFHHMINYASKAITTRSPLETRMTMRRNMANMLFERQGIQFCDPIAQANKRPGAFDDPAVDLAIGESLKMIAKALPVAEESGNRTAVVFDPAERLRHGGNIRKTPQPLGTLINSLTLPKLYQSGYVFDLLTLEDFKASYKKYDTVIFINAFTFGSRERKELAAMLRRKGVTAIFFSAAGFVTPQGFSVPAMEELTGMKIAMDKKGRKSSLVFEKSGIAGITGNRAEFRFYVDDPAAKVFGVYAADKKSGAAKKVLPGGASVIYAGNYPVSAAQWQEILQQAGVEPLTAPGSYIRRHGNLILFHTGKKGTHTIKLPAGSKGAVELYSDRKFNGGTITFVSENEADTKVFKIF